MTDDPYKILKVRRNAGNDEIGRAYRALIRRYHPDINKEPDAFERFHEVQKAFETLSDPLKRAEIDRLRAIVNTTPAKGVYNPSKLPHTRNYDIGDRDKLILFNLIAFAVMVIVSFVVFIILIFVATTDFTYLSEIPLDNDDQIRLGKTVLYCVIAPFLAFILCINLCYFGTHREKTNQSQRWIFGWIRDWCLDCWDYFAAWSDLFRDLFIFLSGLFILAMVLFALMVIARLLP